METGSIRIEQLEIFSTVGVGDAERSAPQRLTASIEMWPPQTFPEMHDEIGRTLDYAVVADAAREFARVHTSHLIETLATALAAHILDRFPIARVEVEIRKFVLPGALYASVKTTTSK